jgi:tetratricopeptide (TPR) repeat protein
MLAGELYRDAGERIELTGQDCMRAAKGALTDARRVAALRERVGIAASIQNEAELRRAFAKAGEHRLGRARDMYAASFRAYLDAVALAPSDLRALNDCALVAVYHIGSERDRAESLLRRCVALGADQVADPGLTAERRNQVLAAWGDAHQNLGKLYLERFDRPDRAETWFKKALEIGPYPRPEVTEFYLPRCAELLRARR